MMLRKVMSRARGGCFEILHFCPGLDILFCTEYVKKIFSIHADCHVDPV